MLHYQNGNMKKKTMNGVPAIGAGNGKYKKSFPPFGTGIGNPKWFPAVWEREFKAYPLGNTREREFPLMPVNCTV